MDSISASPTNDLIISMEESHSFKVVVLVRVQVGSQCHLSISGDAPVL